MVKKFKPPQPDEYFSAGPIQFARFGKNILIQSKWPDYDFKIMQETLVQRFPHVVEEIDQIVGEITALVKTLPPEQVLQRAYGEMTVQHMGKQSEADIGSDELHALRMVDYVQSIIAAVEPAINRKEQISEDDWTRLKILVEKLFEKLNIEYQVCRTAASRKNITDLDMDVEEFYFKAQMYWCNIRGDRYVYHEEQHFKDLLLAHSEVMQELFGISAHILIENISKIIYALIRGMHDAAVELKRFQEATLAKLEPKLKSETQLTKPRMSELMQEVLKENSWVEWQNNVFGKFFGLDLFDLQKVTTLPVSLLEELSWSPGQDKAFFSDGDYKGWPLRIWPIFKRPFIKLSGRYYCFELYSFLDHFYRIIQRTICRLKPDYASVWNNTQQEISEQLPYIYFAQLLPDAYVYRNVYYRWHTGHTDGTQWCETDGLLIYDDHLFIVEVKAGAFTYTSPAEDYPAYLESVENLVLKPSLQGKRFVEYLESAECVPLFDKDHKRVGELSKSDFRYITVCPISLDAFTHLAAQTHRLKRIGIDVGEHPVWSISIDDLRVYADVFRNPLVFLHFIEQRMKAFKSDVLQLEDELDHLGLYVQHNVYTLYAKEMIASSEAHLNFIGYRSDIDKYYSNLLVDPKTPCPLEQEMPDRLKEIVNFLSMSGEKGRAFIASYLLNYGGKWRDNIANGIDRILAEQAKANRAKPLSVHGETKLTIFCWQEPHASRDVEMSIYHTRVVMMAQDEGERFLLELQYSIEGELTEVHWHAVSLSGLSSNQITSLKRDANKLKGRRVTQAKTVLGKIGRNAPCPCGSGKKYKKCCSQE